uniref:Protein kinase domain-containing protein n=1 Tax=Plectus sambesii TaxID=2011161 RepID=A0A914XAK1_9BILA
MLSLLLQLLPLNQAQMILTKNLLPREERRIKKDIDPILKEVGLMLKLDHERVVKCFGCLADDIDLILFMEMMINGSVLQEMRRQKAPLDSATTVKYLKQAMEGVVYIHSQGVIHRDLKCANLLLDASKDVKLADFGISQEIRLKQNGMTSSTFSENGSGGIKGTLLHMAPEVLNSELMTSSGESESSPESVNKKAFTRKSDVWSMGCTAVEMLTMMGPHEELTDGWRTEKFIFQAGSGKLKYIASELCPDAEADIQALLDKIFQLADVRLTSEELLSELEELERRQTVPLSG